MKRPNAKSDGIESPGDIDQNPQSQHLTSGAYTGADVRRDPREGFEVESEPTLEAAKLEVPPAAGCGQDLRDEGREIERVFVFTPGEISLCRGWTADEIKVVATAPRPPRPGRVNLPQLVASVLPDIMAELTPPMFLVPSHYVGTWLFHHRLHRFALMYPSVGCAMGPRNLNLSRVTVDLRRYYSLLSAFMSVPARAAHQMELSLARVDLVRRLIIG